MSAPGKDTRHGLAADRSGTAAIEFALLLPVLLTLFFGCYELESYLLANLKVTAAAETAADLVAQTGVSGGSAGTGVLQVADFAAFTSATEDVLTPLPTSSSQVRIAFASVTYSTGTPVIDWQVDENGAAAISTTNLAVPHAESLSSLGNASAGSTDSVIVVQVTYAYTSPMIGFVLNSTTPYTISAVAFNRPRYVNCIPSAATGTNATSSDVNNNDKCPG
jgi:Flp pilus assembly protein TadG